MRYKTATEALFIADKADNTLFAEQVHGDRRRQLAERGPCSRDANTTRSTMQIPAATKCDEDRWYREQCRSLPFERTRDSLTAVVHKFVVTNPLNLGELEQTVAPTCGDVSGRTR